jgi:hypothetical protein
MVKRITALPGRFDRNGQPFLQCYLTDEIIKRLRPECQIERIIAVGNMAYK